MLRQTENNIGRTNGIDLFFAWFAKGSSHVALQEYADAATAYDQAFAIYNSIGEEDKQRPYRMMWYQTGPFWAYFYTGRYQDVVNLANVTLTETISKYLLAWSGKIYAWQYTSGN
jgi:tetratricopeptide (TPR) repeat protein